MASYMVIALGRLRVRAGTPCCKSSVVRLKQQRKSCSVSPCVCPSRLDWTEKLKRIGPVEVREKATTCSELNVAQEPRSWSMEDAHQLPVGRRCV